jgi:ribosomal protein L37AE/L43A
MAKNAIKTTEQCPKCDGLGLVDGLQKHPGHVHGVYYCAKCQEYFEGPGAEFPSALQDPEETQKTTLENAYQRWFA